MATGAVPVRIRTAISLFVENSHLETRHQGVMFRSPRAFVGSTATLRYEPCTQFINVSQRALHIYFIDGCRRIKIERNNLLCEQAPTEVFRSIFAWLVTLNLLCDFVQCHIIQCSPTVHIAFVSHTDGQGSVSYLDLRNGGILPVRISSKLEGSG